MADEPTDPQIPPADDGPPGLPVGIDQIEIQEEMERSFLDYAMSVIVSRALPDARDGLKPVHRRILWGMHDLGARPDRPTVKCAKVVGEVMGNYHPHGDQAIYDALVRMGQHFSLLHPLVHPKGNFGSPDDPPAASRYTECRLAPLALQMLADIDEDTVDFVDNYSGERTEPTVLPSRFPNLLVNGSQGIAVGMATNIPPHNLAEVIDATVHLIDNPHATVDDLLEHVHGPDFPTGARILGVDGIREAAHTGRGSIKMRATAEIEETERGTRIVVSELPYQVSVGAVAVKIKELVDTKSIDGIRDVNDESAGGRTKLVIDLKRDAPGVVVLNNLFKRTPLQSNFSVNAVALVDGVPRTLNIRQALDAYLDHQREVVTRRSQYRLEKAKARAHIVEGLLRAIDVIDDIIALIRGSADRAAAREGLMSEPFEFTEVQANHILDMPLGRLTRLGREELEGELAELREAIADLEAILASEQRLLTVIKEELLEIKEEFGRERRTELHPDPGALDIEDLIDDEELVVTLSAKGYVKTTPIDEFRTQGRGGKGVKGASLGDGDYVDQLLTTTAHAYLLFFSNRGKVYRLKAHEIPMKDRTARGLAIINLLPLAPEERIQAIIDTRDYETHRFLLFVTRDGTVKKTLMSAYDSPRSNGIIAIGLADDDELVAVRQSSGQDHVMLVTRSGRGIRFAEDEVRPMGRTAGGVRGIKLLAGDAVVSAALVPADGEPAHLLIVTTEGYGKRTAPDEFPTHHRGGQGVRAIRIHERKGQVAAAFMVEPDSQIFMVSSTGTLIRQAVTDISLQGRDATGVRVMNVPEGAEVAAVAPVLIDDEDELEGMEDSETGSQDGEVSEAGGVDGDEGGAG